MPAETSPKWIVVVADQDGAARSLQLEDVLLQTFAPQLLLHDHGCQVWQLTSALPREALQTSLMQALDLNKVDWALLTPSQVMQSYGVLVMDMDSTLITIECIDEIADFAGKKSEVAAITEATMRGEITSFVDSLRRRVALLSGVDTSVLSVILSERLRLSDGAEQLIAGAITRQIRTLLVSGGFTYFANAVRERLGIDKAVANELASENGRLTGEVLGDIIDGAAKQRELIAFCHDHAVLQSASIAVGDGSNDILMMQASGLAVAFRAKPAVKQWAQVHLNVGGLDTLWSILAAAKAGWSLGHTAV